MSLYGRKKEAKASAVKKRLKKPRNYTEEYQKYGASEEAKDKRAKLQAYNRKKGTHGNRDKQDASHGKIRGGKIEGFEPQSKNRARKT
jgi:hypothetical protein